MAGERTQHRVRVRPVARLFEDALAEHDDRIGADDDIMFCRRMMAHRARLLPRVAHGVVARMLSRQPLLLVFRFDDAERPPEQREQIAPLRRAAGQDDVERRLHGRDIAGKELFVIRLRVRMAARPGGAGARVWGAGCGADQVMSLRRRRDFPPPTGSFHFSLGEVTTFGVE